MRNQMNIKINKLTAILLMTLILAIGAYWHWSPYLSIHRMQAAVKDQDSAEFNNYVDYPKLRESFKDQITTRMTERLGGPKASDNPFAAFGKMMAMAMVGSLVDAMVRPESVMRAMRYGKFEQPEKQSDEVPPVPVDTSSGKTFSVSGPGVRVKWAYERSGVNKFVAYAIDSENIHALTTDRLGIVFERSGFSDWKLTEIRLPVIP